MHGVIFVLATWLIAISAMAQPTTVNQPPDQPPVSSGSSMPPSEAPAPAVPARVVVPPAPDGAQRKDSDRAFLMLLLNSGRARPFGTSR